MKKTQWQEIEEIFHRALELPADEVEALLAEATDDETVRSEVRSLLDTAGDDQTVVEELIKQAVPETLAAEEAGQQFGTYRVLELLGSGGMGKVYLAERSDDEYHQRVAIKVTHSGVYGSEVAARFLIERQILASLNHANIARLIDGGTTPEGRPYLVMEYLDGEPIDQFCARHQLSVRRRVELLVAICDAVQYAHEKLVIHRDLKPNNILITEDGVPKLLDFGIAKLLDPQAVEVPSALTTIGPRPLTPAYASPEQLRGQAMHTSSDVYSLGVLLYELLTGVCPTLEDPTDPLRMQSATDEREPSAPSQRLRATSTEPEAAQLEHDFAEPAAKRANLLRGELDTIILKALRFDPTRRYGTAAALGTDLRNYLENRPISARRDTWSYRTLKFTRRNRFGVAAATIAIALLAAFAINTSIMASRLRNERDAVSEEQRRNESVVQFLTDLFQEATPSASQGRELTASQLLDRGAARLEAMSRHPDIQTTLAMTLGLVQLERGDLGRSGDLFSQALAKADGDQQLALVNSNYSRLLHLQGDYERAAEMARTAAATLGSESASEKDEIEALLSLAAIQSTLERYDEARDLLSEIIARQQGLGLSAHQSYNDLAQVEHNAGNVERAVKLQRISLELSREMFQAPHSLLAARLNNLGGNLRLLGEVQEAERLVREAILMQEQLFPDGNHPELATTHTMLGNLQRDQRRFEESLTSYRMALEQAERSLGPVHTSVATILIESSASLRELQRFDEAEARLRRAVFISEETEGAESVAAASLKNSLAGFYEDTGRFDLALEIQIEVLRILELNFGQEHPYVGITLSNLARTERLGGNFESAERFGRRAVKLHQTIGSPAPNRASSHYGLAETHLAKGELAAALEQLVAAQEIFSEFLPPDDPQHTSIKAEIEQLELRLEAD